MSEQISVRIPQPLLERLDALARDMGADRSAIVRDAIRLYLEGPGPGEADHPYARVEDLLGSLTGGPPDLGRRHRQYLKERLGGG